MSKATRQVEYAEVSAGEASRISNKIHVDNDSGCWLWSGAKVSGYGALSCKPSGNWRLAHRATFIYCRGKIPYGMSVLHSCDVRSCVNPSHLFLGTDKDNGFDRKMKGRNAKKEGELNGMAKLSKCEVIMVREDVGRGMSLLAIAKKHGISKSQVARIKDGTSWAHIKYGST